MATVLNEVTEHPSLLGLEGEASALYFQALAPLLEPFGFRGRHRRPPPDAANGLLSFGYTILANDIAGLLEALGFDPFLGYLHRPHYGRASLALDLLEEFRAPFIDRMVLYILRNRILQPERDFEITPATGARLTRDGVRAFFQYYHRFMKEGGVREGGTGYRTLLQQQAGRLRRAILGEAPYRWHGHPLEADELRSASAGGRDGDLPGEAGNDRGGYGKDGVVGYRKDGRDGYREGGRDGYGEQDAGETSEDGWDDEAVDWEDQEETR